MSSKVRVKRAFQLKIQSQNGLKMIIFAFTECHKVMVGSPSLFRSFRQHHLHLTLIFTFALFMRAVLVKMMMESSRKSFKSFIITSSTLESSPINLEV